MSETTKIWPNEERVYTVDGADIAIRATASELIAGRTKTITLETADWTGPDTSYRNAAAYQNRDAFYADVEHNMNNLIATPTSMTGHDGYITRIILDPLPIDADTTRVWIFADQAPPYDVLILFVA